MHNFTSNTAGTDHPAEQVEDVLYRYRLVPDRGFEYVSPSAEALVGYTPEEHYADPDLGFKLVHPDDRPLLERVAEGGDPIDTVVLRWITRDGRTIWVEQRNTPIHDEDGRMIAIVGVARDIGAAVQHRRALEDRIQHQASLVDCVSDSVIATDNDLRVTSWNAAAEKMYGWTEAEAIGRKVRDVLQTEMTPAQTAQALAEVKQHGRWRGRVTHRHKDGTAMIVDASTSVVRDRDGEPAGLVAINRDVTELVQLEAELGHARTMAALGRLASGIAHDFNNLLMGMSGAADVLLRRLPARAQLRNYAREIKRSAVAGASMTRQLLDVVGHRPDSRDGVALDASIESLRPTLDRLLGAAIELRAELGAGDAGVMLDEGGLAQVLLNLAANARDAMPEGGALTIATERATVPAESSRDDQLPRPGEYAVLTVSDTGCGMDAETAAHAFEPFFTTKGRSGSGLGLATLYGAIAGVGGHVELRSRPGEGATFRIFLPICCELPQQAELHAPAEPPRAPAPRGHTTILLVEDNRLVRAVTREYLEADGHDVVAVADAGEALRWCGTASHVPDLVVADLQLPGLSGPRLVRALRARFEDLPVVFMSAHPPTEPLDDVVLAKPFEASDLQGAVRAALPDPDAHAPGPPEQAKPPARDATVLAVENNPIAREAIVELLEDAGYRVLSASTAAEALLIYERGGAPDLIATDVELPDFAGEVLVESARELHPNTPVVFMSGRAANDPRIRQLIALPEVRYLQKPFDIDRLLRSAEDLLRQRGKPAA